MGGKGAIVHVRNEVKVRAWEEGGGFSPLFLILTPMMPPPTLPPTFQWTKGRVTGSFLTLIHFFLRIIVEVTIIKIWPGHTMSHNATKFLFKSFPCVVLCQCFSTFWAHSFDEKINIFSFVAHLSIKKTKTVQL